MCNYSKDVALHCGKELNLMKKLCSSVTAAAISLMGICGFAEPSSDTAVTVGRIELIDYILIAGAALFLLGMLFILLSMYAGTGKKKCDAEPDMIEEYDDYTEEEALDDGVADEEEVQAQEAEETVEIPEEVIEAEEADETDFEEDTEPVEEETAESAKEQEETSAEEEAQPEPEVIPEPEPEVISEPEPELPKVRITLTGLNNFDVKIMEFTDKATLGRRSGNDIVISDNAVSGNHCEFIFEDEKLYVADLNSTNGTMVNDEPIVRAEVNSGDVLLIGKCKYRINISM